MFNLKNAETFHYEIRDYMDMNDCSILESILAYGEKYGLDEDYIKKNLMTAGLKDQLREECETLNLLKKDNIVKFDI